MIRFAELLHKPQGYGMDLLWERQLGLGSSNTDRDGTKQQQVPLERFFHESDVGKPLAFMYKSIYQHPPPQSKLPNKNPEKLQRTAGFCGFRIYVPLLL